MQQGCFNDHGSVKTARSSLVFPIVVSTFAIVGPIKDESKVQGVSFGPQPLDRLACQCSAIYAVSALPGKKYFIWNSSWPCATLSDSRPSISGVIITKKVRYQGEKLAQPFPPLPSFRLGLLAFARSYTHVPRSCCIAMQW